MAAELTVKAGVTRRQSLAWWQQFEKFTSPPRGAIFAEQEFEALSAALTQSLIMYEEDPLTDEPIEWMAETLLELVSEARLYGAEGVAAAMTAHFRRRGGHGGDAATATEGEGTT